MIALLITTMGIETLFTLGLLYYYEDKLKSYTESIGDYKRALNLAQNKPSNDHDAYLQLENKKLKKELEEAYNSYSNMAELASQYGENWNKAQLESELYKDAYDSEHDAIHYELENNDALKAQIKSLQEELGYLRNKAGEQGIQYESHTYKSNTWDSSKYEIFTEL